MTKMYILPKAICRFNAFLIRFSKAFFHKTRNNHLNICMEPQRTLNRQRNLLRKKITAGSQKSPSDFKLYRGAKVTETLWNCHKHRSAIKEKNTERAQQKTHMQIVNS